MTLRGRLTTAFLAVVLGPVLLGAFFVGAAVTVVAADRAMERLNHAVTSVATSVGALCRQLNAAAGAVAIVTDPAGRQAAANRVVAGGLGAAVRVSAADGNPIITTAGAPAEPWIDCAGQSGLGSGAAGTGYGAIAARVQLRDAFGRSLGSVTVVSTLDQTFINRLADAANASVTLIGSSPQGGPVAVHSTEPAGTRDAVVRTAAALTGKRAGQTSDGTRYVRRVGPSLDEPLPLALSVPRRAPQGLYALLVAGVVLTCGFAVAMAWSLARSTTRPLAELARAADRVAGGDLAARVPVRAQDEVGRLAATFNRMTRETQAYVQALTASRDQLRGHLAILGDTLSSTHDLGRILQVILQTALAATGARAGVVLLLDPAEGTLVGQCAEGLDERWPEPDRRVEPGTHPGRERVDRDLSTGRDLHADQQTAPQPEEAAPGEPLSLAEEPTEELVERDPASLRVPVGSGLLGSVAATGVPLRGHIDRDGPALSPYEPRCRTYVAVPFSIPGPFGGPAASGPAGTPSALGVLALYDRLGSDEFDDSDVTTLRTFAGQAAVAVDNVRAHQEAQRLSLTDPLTGLWNYRYLQESVRREVERASRFHRMLTVLAMDLDRFKEVNDTYGHGAGDAVLAEFARRVRTGLREVDLAFRQGGEEFVVLLPETDQGGAVVVAERLGAIVRDEPVPIHTQDYAAMDVPSHIAITVSIGIAVYPDHGATAAQVLEAADDALYAAKAAGRDTYRVAEAGRPLRIEEIPVRAAATTPDDGLPRAGGADNAAVPPRTAAPCPVCPAGAAVGPAGTKAAPAGTKAPPAGAAVPGGPAGGQAAGAGDPGPSAAGGAEPSAPDSTHGGAGTGGAPSGTHPPRQTRGR